MKSTLVYIFGLSLVSTVAFAADPQPAGQMVQGGQIFQQGRRIQQINPNNLPEPTPEERKPQLGKGVIIGKDDFFSSTEEKDAAGSTSTQQDENPEAPNVVNIFE